MKPIELPKEQTFSDDVTVKILTSDWKLHKAAIESHNKLLEGAEIVWTDEYHRSDRCWMNYKDDKEATRNGNTHRALLIDIQPISCESADDILRDFVKGVEDRAYKGGAFTEYEYDIASRAQAYFKRKGGK